MPFGHRLQLQCLHLYGSGETNESFLTFNLIYVMVQFFLCVYINDWATGLINCLTGLCVLQWGHSCWEPCCIVTTSVCRVPRLCVTRCSLIIGAVVNVHMFATLSELSAVSCNILNLMSQIPKTECTKCFNVDDTRCNLSSVYNLLCWQLYRLKRQPLKTVFFLFIGHVTYVKRLILQLCWYNKTT